ncbi:MAG: ubiquinone/menaquinone biosynthesis methyltransferase [Nitrospirae bacterium]|nr:MAG: ubiquinone/menaquinone biosynthesis methyltransferase [Nitrospirota bacterium]
MDRFDPRVHPGGGGEAALAGGKPAFVHRIFCEIAPRYELVSRLISLGQIDLWRRELIRRAAIPPKARVLDVGTGTGAIARAIARHHPDAEVTGCDVAEPMLAVARARNPEPRRIRFVHGDALALPFPDHSFDVVTSAFLLRNVADLHRALREQVRVARPGGRVACLDICPPGRGLAGALFYPYFFRLVPFLGRLLTPSRDAYRYLPSSTLSFPPPEALAEALGEAGLTRVDYVRCTFGIVAVHVGEVAAG